MASNVPSAVRVLSELQRKHGPAATALILVRAVPGPRVIPLGQTAAQSRQKAGTRMGKDGEDYRAPNPTATTSTSAARGLSGVRRDERFADRFADESATIQPWVTITPKRGMTC